MSTGEGLAIADIGTGSGCIAVALAKELPMAKLIATDISRAALEVARRNAARHRAVSRISFVESNLLDKIEPCNLDLIVSNPPYVGRREKPTLAREVRDHEPDAALFGGEQGYELYANLIAQAAKQLKPGGVLVLELGHDSLSAVRPLLDDGNWIAVGITNDLAGIPRVIAAEKT
jgi:release factor glutamine methyltransferase